MALVGVKALSTLLDRLAAKVGGRVDQVMYKQANELKNDLISGSPVDKGQFRAAWQGPIQLGKGHYKVVNNTVYGPVLEYGGYPGVGPKTAEQPGTTVYGDIDINAGIYPTQVPYGFTRRALSKRIKEIEAELGKVGKYVGS